MDSGKKDLGRSVHQKWNGWRKGDGIQPQGRATHCSPRNRLLTRPLTSWVSIPCGPWNSSSRSSIKEAGWLSFYSLNFVINVSDPILSIMVPLSQNVD